MPSIIPYRIAIVVGHMIMAPIDVHTGDWLKVADNQAKELEKKSLKNDPFTTPAEGCWSTGTSARTRNPASKIEYATVDNLLVDMQRV